MATSDKYDRQLRLWGPSGQKSLASTLVVLVGSSSCGTESLKNLVLPGVGAFLIVDDVVYDNADVNFGEIVCGDSSVDGKFGSPSCNFFAAPANNCPTKAAMACGLLSELNPDVSGFHCTVSSLEEMDHRSFLEKLKATPPQNGSASTSSILVMSADQPSPVLLPLSHACHALSLPLVNVRSYGLLGYVRIQTPSPYHVVKDAKRTNKLVDLRLSGKEGVFEGLNKVYDSIGKLEDMTDSKEHSHVPYVIILLQALEKWKETKNKAPSTYEEKEEFRRLIKSMAKDYDNELNFQEGYDQAHLAWVDATVSEEGKMVLDRCSEEEFFGSAIESDMDTGDGSNGKSVNMAVLQFQLMALALKRFLKENDDRPPLEGTIPDMTSDTKTFVALQEAYRQQAEMDRSKITQHISDILEQCKSKFNGCRVNVEMPSEEDITTFCKNAKEIRILETRPLYAEYQCQDPSSPIVTALSKYLNFDSSSLPNFDTLQSDSREDLLCSTMDPYETDLMQTPLLWFIALRACDAFYDRHGHYPGKHDQTLALEADVSEVYKLMGEVVGNMGLKECDFIVESLLSEKGKDVAREVVRYDEAEIHTIAAVVGGVASQEAVKLITGQYVPVDDTYMYNGIASTAVVQRF